MDPVFSKSGKHIGQLQDNRIVDNQSTVIGGVANSPVYASIRVSQPQLVLDQDRDWLRQANVWTRCTLTIVRSASIPGAPRCLLFRP